MSNYKCKVKENGDTAEQVKENIRDKIFID